MYIEDWVIVEVWRFKLLEPDYEYRTSAIISRGLYIFYPISKDHFFVFKEVFSENYVLMYGLYSRAAYDGARTVFKTELRAFDFVFLSKHGDSSVDFFLLHETPYQSRDWLSSVNFLLLSILGGNKIQ